MEYVDDTMWAFRANTSADLNEKLDRLLTLVVTCFRKYRLSLNFVPGKTECMIQYRGKGARDFLCQNVIDQGVMQRRGPSWKSSLGHVLEVLGDNKHVGSLVTVTVA